MTLVAPSITGQPVRISKAKAHYRAASASTVTCHFCVHRTGGTCELVEGAVDRHSVCDLFAPATTRTNASRIVSVAGARNWAAWDAERAVGWLHRDGHFEAAPSRHGEPEHEDVDKHLEEGHARVRHIDTRLQVQWRQHRTLATPQKKWLHHYLGSHYITHVAADNGLYHELQSNRPAEQLSFLGGVGANTRSVDEGVLELSVRNWAEWDAAHMGSPRDAVAHLAERHNSMGHNEGDAYHFHSLMHPARFVSGGHDHEHTSFRFRDREHLLGHFLGAHGMDVGAEALDRLAHLHDENHSVFGHRHTDFEKSAERSTVFASISSGQRDDGMFSPTGKLNNWWKWDKEHPEQLHTNGHAWGEAWAAAARKRAVDNAHAQVGKGAISEEHKGSYQEGHELGHRVGTKLAHANEGPIDSKQVSDKAAPLYAAAKRAKDSGDHVDHAKLLGAAHGFKQASADKGLWEKTRGVTPHDDTPGGRGTKVKPSVKKAVGEIADNASEDELGPKPPAVKTPLSPHQEKRLKEDAGTSPLSHEVQHLVASKTRNPSEAMKDVQAERSAVMPEIQESGLHASQELSRLDIRSMRKPPHKGTGGGSGEWDWYHQLNPHEQARLKDNGWLRDAGPAEAKAAKPEDVADRIRRMPQHQQASHDEAMQHWLGLTRTVDAAKALEPTMKRAKATGHVAKHNAAGQLGRQWEVRNPAGDVLSTHPTQQQANIHATRLDKEQGLETGTFHERAGTMPANLDRFGAMQWNDLAPNSHHEVAKLFGPTNDAAKYIAEHHADKAHDLVTREFGSKHGLPLHAMKFEDYKNEVESLEHKVEHATPVSRDEEWGEQYHPDIEAAANRLDELLPESLVPEGSHEVKLADVHRQAVAIAKLAGHDTAYDEKHGSVEGSSGDGTPEPVAPQPERPRVPEDGTAGEGGGATGGAAGGGEEPVKPKTPPAEVAPEHHPAYLEGYAKGREKASANSAKSALQISRAAAPHYAKAKKARAEGDLEASARHLGVAHGFKDVSREKGEPTLPLPEPEPAPEPKTPEPVTPSVSHGSGNRYLGDKANVENVPLSTLKELADPKLSLDVLRGQQRTQDLKQSIANEGGYRDPIIIQHNATTGKSLIIDGHHRLTVAEDLGHSSVPATIFQVGKEDSKPSSIGLPTEGTAHPEPEPEPKPEPPVVQPTVSGKQTPADSSKYLKGSPKYNAFNEGHAGAVQHADMRDMGPEEARREAEAQRKTVATMGPGLERAKAEGRHAGFVNHAERIERTPPAPEPKPRPAPTPPPAPKETEYGEDAYDRGKELGLQHGKTMTTLEPGEMQRMANARMAIGAEHTRQGRPHEGEFHYGYADGLRRVAMDREEEQNRPPEPEPVAKGPNPEHEAYKEGLARGYHWAKIGAGSSNTPEFLRQAAQAHEHSAHEFEEQGSQVDAQDSYGNAAGMQKAADEHEAERTDRGDLTVNPYESGTLPHKNFELARAGAKARARDQMLTKTAAERQAEKVLQGYGEQANKAGAAAGYTEHARGYVPPSMHEVGDVTENPYDRDGHAGKQFEKGRIAGKTLGKTNGFTPEEARRHSEWNKESAAKSGERGEHYDQAKELGEAAGLEEHARAIESAPPIRPEVKEHAANLLLANGYMERHTNPALKEAIDYRTRHETDRPDRTVDALAKFDRRSGPTIIGRRLYSDPDRMDFQKTVHDALDKPEAKAPGYQLDIPVPNKAQQQRLDQLNADMRSTDADLERGADAGAARQWYEGIAHSVAHGGELPATPEELAGKYRHGAAQGNATTESFTPEHAEAVASDLRKAIENPDSNHSELMGLGVRDLQHHADVMAKGEEIAHRIDARPDVAAAKTAYEDASQFFPRSLVYPARRDYTEDSDYQAALDQYRATEKAQTDLQKEQQAAGRKYSETMRTATKEELAKERDFGKGAATAHLRVLDKYNRDLTPESMTPAARKKMELVREGLTEYPSDWLTTSNEHPSPLGVGTERTQRSHYSHLSSDGGAVVLQRGDKDYHAVAVHEVGHHMQNRVEGLSRLERTHIVTRAPGQTRAKSLKSFDSTFGGKASESAIEDKFVTGYVGKIYKDTPESPHEVLTVGTQSVLGRDTKKGDRGDGVYGRLVGIGGNKTDPLLRQFVLGTLAHHGRHHHREQP